jgi:lipopolysaccharide export LptBFGC system permease protein LptF
MANSVTCLMFVLVGVSSGILLRKGTQLAALAVAVGYALIYWVFSLRLGEQLAERGVIDPWLGAWGPLALFFAVGGWLTHRAFRE